MTLIERSFREKIVLVGMVTSETTQTEVEQSLDELALLVDTAGADVMARVIQRRDAPDPATFVGKGKAEEIRDISYEVDSDTVVFDEELSPAQQRNLEKIFGRTAIDRTAVILDIFAQNARTQEGKAQVELALLRYRLPRLRGRLTSLSQQTGGFSGQGVIGTRGPGETQLEVDRRRLMRRVTHLERELKELEKNRSTQRRQRQRSRIRNVSLVGYTNAGKSTLLNQITGAGTLAENKLFSTLDPITRRGTLPGGESVLFSDTVGFVRKLPHQLVEAFRSTLDEVNDADLLVHVVDGSSADPQAQIDAVHGVLNEIETTRIPELLVFNKTDRLDAHQRADLQALLDRYPGSIKSSALTGDGVEEVVRTIGDRLRAMRPVVEFMLPFDRGDLIAMLHREGEVITESETPDGMFIRARFDGAVAGNLSDFLVNESDQKI